MTQISGRSRRLVSSLAYLCVWLIPVAAMAQPQIGSFEPRALRLGAEQIVVLQGSNYDASARLISDLQLTQRIVDVQPGRITLAVTAEGLPGIHPVWIATQAGVSSSVLVAVDSIETKAWQDSLEQLPIALHGDLRGNVVQQASFPVKQGQRISLEVESRRLGAALQPVIRVFDQQRRQLAAATPDPRLKGDCRTVFTATADQTVTVELSDMLRRGATPGTFRLKIGDFPIAETALPMAVGSGEAGIVGTVLDQPELSAALPQSEPFPTWLPAIVGSGQTAMLPMVRVVPWAHRPVASTMPEQAVDSPVTLTGDLKAGTNDRVRVKVPSGQRINVDLWSYRLGVEGDFVVDVRTVAGQSLGRVDDLGSSRDPKLEIAVPADQTEVDVFVSELLGQRASCPYLLEVTPLDQPRIDAVLETDHLSVGRNRVLLSVPIQRSNYAGDITLHMEPEIPGVHFASMPCSANADRALLQLWCDGPFPDQVVRFVASAGDATTRARRSAVNSPEQIWQSELVAVGYQEMQPTSVALKLDSGSVLWQGANRRVTVDVVRAEGQNGPIRLLLETSQKMPRKIVKQDNQDREVDAIERALRLESAVTIPAGQSSAEVVLIVPTDMAEQSWNLSLVAEVLSDDGSTVLNRSGSPLIAAEIKGALSLTLTSSSTIGFVPAAEQPAVIEGTIERKNGFDGPVIVTLDGLPGMSMGPELEIPADQTAFRLELRIPAESKIEEWQNVSVVARAWDADGFLQSESLGTKLTVQVPQ